VSYISIAEYISAPTSVDTSQLYTGGTTDENLDELANVIGRASDWANGICYQILAATLDTEMDSGVYVRHDGTVRARCSFWPFRELDSFSVGPVPSRMAPIIDPADVWLQGRKVLVVPVAGTTSNAVSRSVFALYGPVRPGTRVYIQWSYWNGWFHSTLASASLASATSLTLTMALPQSAAGVSLTIPDAANTETVQVASTFTGGTVIPLVNPTVYAHPSLGKSIPLPQSITVTELPPKIRQATISLTSCLIKVRGTQAEVMPNIGGAPSREALIEGGGLEDYQVAVDLLEVYRRSA
jgi:hypothetical protein